MTYIVLGLLMLKDMTIYELNNSFKQGLSLIYAASYGSLQNAVKNLLKDGAITYIETVENGRNKKIYTINDDGRKLFKQWMFSPLTEKKLETTLLSKIYFLGLISEKKDQLSIIQGMIDTVKQVTKELSDYQQVVGEMEIPEAYQTIAMYQIKTLDYGVMSHEAGLNWLHDLYEEVKNGPML